MTNLDNILRSRDIPLPTKVRLFKAMVCPAIMYGCESWTVKKVEHWRIDAFELVLENTLESPMDCKEIQPVHPKGDQSWVFLEGMMLKLKLQYFGHLMRRLDSWEKTLMLGGIGGRRRGDDRGWDGWMASPTRWTWVWVNSRSWWWTRRPGMLWLMGLQGVGHDWATELNWTELNPPWKAAVV